MIKKCKVILNNDAVTVVNFDETQVQLPSIKKEAQYISVLFDNGKYSVVDEENIETTDSSAAKPRKNNRNKKVNSEVRIEKENN